MNDLMLAKFAAMEDALKSSMAAVQACVTLVHTKLSTLTDQVLDFLRFNSKEDKMLSDRIYNFVWNAIIVVLRKRFMN